MDISKIERWMRKVRRPVNFSALLHMLPAGTDRQELEEALEKSPNIERASRTKYKYKYVQASS